MLPKVSDALFRREMEMAKRDFPFRLQEMEEEGELDLEFVRYRAANQFFGITKRAGEYLANNFDCGSSDEAQSTFNEIVDVFGRCVLKMVESLRQRTEEMDENSRHGMETLVKRVVKAKRKRRSHDSQTDQRS